ncbi:MAG: hypothetical protein E6Q77_09750 [Rhizobium sp.]|nr:MAG: hypothetical protein E6Q77_09750 [Rhizobium sp.]
MAVNYDQIVVGGGRDAVAQALALEEQGQAVALVIPANGTAYDPVIVREAVDLVIRSGSISMAALRTAVAQIADSRSASDRRLLAEAGVEVLTGDVQFTDATTITVQAGIVIERISAPSIILACGTAAAPIGRGFGEATSVVTAENWLSLENLPESMVIVGAGETGLEHAILLSRLGVEVTVVDEHSNVFELCGGLMDLNLFEAQSLGVAFRLNDEVIGVESRSTGKALVVRLSSGRQLIADAAMTCVGRVGRTNGLNLEAIGVGLDEEGRAWCDAEGHTWVPSIIAVGAVVGFRAEPALVG